MISEDRKEPVRPAIPLVFGCACVFWLSCAISYEASRWAKAEVCFWLTLILLGLAIILIFALLLSKIPSWSLFFISALVGASLACASAYSLHVDQLVSISDNENVSVCFLEDSKSSTNGEAAFARIQLENDHSVTAQVEIRTKDPILYGEEFFVRGSFVAADWSSDQYLWQNGAIGKFRASWFEKNEAHSLLSPLYSLRFKAIQAIGSDNDSHALLQAIVCGYKHSVKESQVYSEFQMCGVAHLIAVSGAHLVIVTALFASLLKLLRVPRKASIVILVILMLSYLLVAGVPLSAIRATLMSSVGILSLFGRRRASALNALGVSIFGLIVYSPVTAVSVSFTLSVLSTAGIVLFAPLMQDLFNRTFLAQVPLVSESMALTGSASLLSQLYACSIFHVAPLISPLANIVVAPLFPLVCSVGLVASLVSSISLPGSELLLALSSLFAGALSKLVSLLSQLPFASIPFAISTEAALVISVIATFILWVSWRSFNPKVLGAVAVLVLLVFGFTFIRVNQEDAIIMLDVGQGDAFLLRSQGSSLLIDTGNHDSQLLEQLALTSTYSLDAVLLSHADDDHVGSLDALEKGLSVRRAFVSQSLADSSDSKCLEVYKQAQRTADEVVSITQGESFQVGAFIVQSIWPNVNAQGAENEDSLCLLVEYDGDSDGFGDAKILFTGDAEAAEIQAMIDSGRLGSIDVFKVGHHGSKGGITKEQLNALSPKIALISVGVHNRYGHPSSETLALLEAADCKVFRTDVDGRVKCCFSPESISVELQ